MPLHEQKNCPRCNQLFTCRVGDVCQCECSSVQLNSEVLTFIDFKYHDCLCLHCLQNLKNKYNFFIEKHFPK